MAERVSKRRRWRVVKDLKGCPVLGGALPDGEKNGCNDGTMGKKRFSNSGVVRYEV